MFLFVSFVDHKYTKTEMTFPKSIEDASKLMVSKSDRERFILFEMYYHYIEDVRVNELGASVFTERLTRRMRKSDMM